MRSMLRIAALILVLIGAASGASALEVEGRVVDPAGEPVEAARLAMPLLDGGWELGETDSSGRFHIDSGDVEAQPVMVVRAPGLAKRIVPLAGHAGSPLELRLARGARLELQLGSQYEGAELAGQ